MPSFTFPIRSPVLGLAVGLTFFALCSLLREAMQPHLANAPYLNAFLTVAIFILAGTLVGASSPRHSLLYGLILGVLAGVFVILQVGHFSHINWAARPTLQIFATYAGIGIILCETGALAGRALAGKWLSSNYRIECPREL
jgi:hypothetical protein